jgi:hypothetical protein
MGAAMPDPLITQRRIQLEHVSIGAAKPFAKIKAALEELLPPPDPATPETLRQGDIGRAKGRCSTLWRVLSSTAGINSVLLPIADLPRNDVQYEIRNPFAAIRMTQYIQATAYFADAAKRASLKAVISTSQISAREATGRTGRHPVQHLLGNGIRAAHWFTRRTSVPKRCAAWARRS